MAFRQTFFDNNASLIDLAVLFLYCFLISFYGGRM